MMKKINILFSILILTAIIIPPWNIDWKTNDESSKISFNETTFSGYSFLTYGLKPQEKTIAWDGLNTGGKFVVNGQPKIHFLLLTGELLIILMIWILARLIVKLRLKKSSLNAV